MAFFTEQMETLTNELLTARHERVAFVNEVEQQSHKIITDAKTFMRVVGEEHKAMATRLRAELATNDKERLRASNAQRQRTREHNKNARKGLLEMLSQNRRQRQQDVAKLRKDLSGDLKQAAQIWQRMFQVDATTNGAAKGKTKVKVTAGATVSQASPAAKSNGPAKPADAKPPTHAAAHAGSPVKAEETSKPGDHGHAADSKKTVHEPSHGEHGKPKEPRHSH